MNGADGAPVAPIDIETNHFYAGELADPEKARAAFAAAHRIGCLVADGQPARFSVMIDDYNETGALTRSETLAMVASWTPRPDYVVFESDVARFAEGLIESLRPAVLGTDGTDLYLYTTSNSLLLWSNESAPKTDYLTMFARKYALPQVPGAESAPEPEDDPAAAVGHADAATRTLLRSGAGAGADAVYSCSLLIACWNLGRLGVEPFAGVERFELGETSDGTPEHVWSILPSRFLKVEANAREIIDLCQSKRLNKKVRSISHIFL